MATGVPYLGSKISLISKSEIRYEGILYTIDTKESTVALAKVRSYGTEDRPTDRPVAPRDETYEYIIFRGSDIKDIRVCQPPKPRPTLEGGLPNDPAIVQHSRGPPGSEGGPPGQAPGSGAGDSGAAAGAPSAGKPGYGPIGTGNASSAAAGGAAPGGPAFSAAPGSGAPQNAAGGANQANGSPVLDMLKDGQSGTSSPAVGAPGHAGHGRPSSRTSGGEARRGRGGHRGGNRGGVGAGGQHRGGGQVQAGSYRGGSNGQSGGHRGGRGGFQPGRPSQSKKDTLKFDSEYDFEQANEEFKEIISKFEKVHVEGDGEKVVVEGSEEIEEGEITAAEDSKTPSVNDADSSAGGGSQAPPCYDKAKSFFDNISCEAVERSKGQRNNRPDWKAEKKLNRETFGTTGFNRRNYNNQGYHRGGGGRGGYGNNRGGGYGFNQRGGYGGYHNNHQQQHQQGGGYNHHNNRYNNRGGRGGWNPNGGGRGRGGPRGGGPRPWGEVRAEQ